MTSKKATCACKKRPEGLFIRAIYMIILAIVNAVIRYLVLLLSIVQFIFVLVQGVENSTLLDFSKTLTTFSYKIMRFLTFEDKVSPFPFSSKQKKESVEAEDIEKDEEE